MFGFFSNHELEVYAPVQGKVVDITEVDDVVFSQKVMGDGVAIEPTTESVVAPFDGTVRMVAGSKHAIAIAKQDVEVLIHVGLDTVALQGEGFTAHVHKGEFVRRGTLLLTFDRAYIEKMGKSLMTAIVVMNTAEKITEMKKYYDDVDGKIMDLKLKK